MPINIKDITIRNFQSFGDYETKLDLESLGPVLIVGELEESTQNKVKKSNGAGKSSIARAIVWGLKGRTAERARPGDTIINHQTGKNCMVRLSTTDGYIIERARKFDGKDELLFYKIGDKDTTLSTNTAAQKAIDKTFKVDYDMLASTVFFEQRAKPILELPPKQRSQILEKMLQLNKINYRAEIAKEKLKSITDDQAIASSEMDIFKDEKSRLEISLEEAEEFKSRFEDSRINKIIELDKRILSIKEEIEDMELPDLEAIRAKCEIIDKLIDKSQELKEKINTANLEASVAEMNVKNSTKRRAEVEKKLNEYQEFDIKSIEKTWDDYNKALEEIEELKTNYRDSEYAKKELDGKIARLNTTIEEWNEKVGTVCPSCNQSIDHSHTDGLIEPYKKELKEDIKKAALVGDEYSKFKDRLKTRLESVSKPSMSLEYVRSVLKDKEALQETLANLVASIESESKKINSDRSSIVSLEEKVAKIEKSLQSKPKYSIREVEEIIKNHTNLEKNIELLKHDKDNAKSEENPYIIQISKINKTILETTKKVEDSDKKIKRLDMLIRHYTYIRKAYYDKNKIKSFILNSMIPILNDRFKYYLDQFGFDNLKLEFNNLLQVESDKWDISMCSGGERQCIDLALMFALYDLNSIQHGRQCNIMVLDEVDSRLDPHYVDALASVLIDDFGKESPTKPSTILAISHNNGMFDVFPTKIRVKKKDGFSHVEIEK